MTKVQVADSETYGVLNVFINENTEKCQESEIVAEDVAYFQEVWAEFNDKKEEAQSLPTSLAADNSKLKASLSATASDIFKYLQSHAVRKKDQTLLDLAKPAKTKMMGLPDAAFITLMNDMAQKVTTYSDILVLHAFTEAEQTAFKADVATFNAAKPQVKIIRKLKKGTTQSLQTVHDELNSAVEDRLMVSILALQKKYPEFVQQFLDLCEKSIPPVAATQVTIKTVDDATNAPEPYVSILLPDLEKTIAADAKGKLVLKKLLPTDKNAPMSAFDTDANGKLVVKTGSLKALLIKASKSSFENQEVTVTKIKRGKVTEIELRMKRAA
jgi:translation initiation factor 2 beta subunit (eIF-2beta)/eIF-5